MLGNTRRHLGDLDAALETDRDWVVVGSTPEQMTALGYRPVGKDFPVFLHPETQEEYALARTERKTAPGYKGFVAHAAPDVTLEQDLARRDLTINAMALDEAGTLIDPYQGKRDLDAGILRHVSPAFIEDPVRILRVARFAARFPNFKVAPETAALMREMVRNGEADALVPERVMQEISRGLMEAKPSRMLNVLVSCGLIDRLFAELEDLGPTSAALDRAAQRELVLPSRFAILAGACRSSRAVSDFLGKLRVQQDAASVGALVSRAARAAEERRDISGDRRSARTQRRISSARALRMAVASLRSGCRCLSRALPAGAASGERSRCGRAGELAPQ